MGNWNINIQGIGAHHNLDYPNDANLLAATFVRQLKKVGHTIETATFTHGAKQDLVTNPPTGDELVDYGR